MPCELCDGPGGELIWADDKCRVVVVHDPNYPGFCRVVWREHVKEMTDLDPVEQRHLMQRVFAVETALRRLLHPDKINLASLGNMTPHVHWHVIPRFADDRHFPQPVWGTPASREHTAVPVAAPDIARALESVMSETAGTAQQQGNGSDLG
jgi:diadenosine tetraphosphate (Ap4A) HIT family hydrolase